jgi:hypothetical protein
LKDLIFKIVVMVALKRPVHVEFDVTRFLHALTRAMDEILSFL